MLTILAKADLGLGPCRDIWGRALLFCLTIWYLQGYWSERSAVAARPNILLAISDDQSYPPASCLGDPVVMTPGFDRIAREGVLFTHSYSGLSFLYCEDFDKHLSRMLKSLERLGELENAIAVVTSDNGMPFTRMKATLYDGGVRMPKAIRWGISI